MPADGGNPVLMTSSADLEPCGLDTSASRTCVDIVDAAEEESEGTAPALSARDLTGTWFAGPRDQPHRRCAVVLCPPTAITSLSVLSRQPVLGGATCPFRA